MSIKVGSRVRSTKHFIEDTNGKATRPEGVVLVIKDDSAIVKFDKPLRPTRSKGSHEVEYLTDLALALVLAATEEIPAA